MVVTLLVFASGFIINGIMKKTKYGIELSKIEALEPSWDDIKDEEEILDEQISDGPVKNTNI